MILHFFSNLSNTKDLQKYPSQKPITALLPTTPLDNKSLLFSSQGFNLRIHTRPLNNLIFSQQIFKHQIIHGITRLNYSRPLTSGDAGKHCSEEILIHGGRWIRRARFAFSYLTGDFEAVWSILGEEVECEDWILDVVRFSGRSAAVGVTAHDDLVLLSWELEGSFNQIIGPTRTRVVGRGSRSILYAAHLLWDRSKSGHETEDRLIIAGGTAFGQILVQTATFGAGHEEEVLIETRYVVSGHEGSIFGVRLSGPLIQSDGTKLRFLSSCSDDRTVRVWDVTDLNPTIARGWIDEQVTGTGFQATTTKVSLATGIGHISRVWSLRYVYLTQEPQQNLLVKIVSAGEDGTCRLWSLRTQHGQYTLEADDIISEHCGKNIWSLEVASTSKKDNHFDVITGGADGAILAATISTDSVTSLVPTLKAWTVQDALDSALDMKLQKSQKQCFRAMTLLQDSAILVATENGDILLAKPVASTNYVEKEFQWNHIAQADTFRGYSIASATPDKAVAVIADASGSIYFYRAKTQEFRLILESTSSKVSGLWIEEWDNETLGTTDLVLLAFDLGTKQARISFIREKVVSTGISRHINTWCIDIGQAIVVAAACHSEGGYTLLAIGFRDGAIKIYQHMNESGSRSSPFESTNPESSYSPLASITNCEKESITKLTWIITSTTKYLCSTARDGHFTIHSISSSTASVTVLHKLLLPFTPNIEGFWFCPITSHLVIYGFHSTNLIIYNVSTSHEIASIPCGGAHRTWSLDLSSSLSPETGRVITQAVFAWTQVNTLRTVTVSDAHNAVVQQGGHGRDIKTCAIAPIPFDTHTNLRKDYLIATGAEDTNIHLSIPAPSDADFTILATIRKHNTGVRHLQWSSDGKRVFSSAGKEEFCVWRVTALPMKGLSIGVYCESMVPVEGGVSDLRILAFDVTALPGNQEEDERFAITLGYSNSMIKVFKPYRTFLKQ